MEIGHLVFLSKLLRFVNWAPRSYGGTVDFAFVGIVQDTETRLKGKKAVMHVAVRKLEWHK